MATKLKGGGGGGVGSNHQKNNLLFADSPTCMSFVGVCSSSWSFTA